MRDSATSTATANVTMTAPAATSWAARTRMSVLLQAGASNHVCPARQFRAHEGVGLRQRHRRGIEPELPQAIAHGFGGLDDLRELRIEAFEDRTRRRGGREDGEHRV